MPRFVADNQAVLVSVAIGGLVGDCTVRVEYINYSIPLIYKS